MSADQSIVIGVIGFALPSERYAEIARTDMGMPAQTQAFGISLLKALKAGGARCVQVSSAPVTDYPNNSRILFTSHRQVEDGVGFFELGFVNLTILKHTTRLINAIAKGIPELRAQGTQYLLVHGLHSSWLLAGLAVSQALNIPAVVVMTDPPSLPHPFDTTLSRALKRIDRVLVRRLLQRFSGAIVLTEALATDFAPNLPFLVLSGIATESKMDHSRSWTPSSGEHGHAPPRVVYAGGVSEEYGIAKLLGAKRLSRERFRLTIYGKGPMVAAVERASETDSDIEYGGVLTRQQIQVAYEGADLLVNVRSPHQMFTKYSFPSKLIEYMLSGRPTLTTKLPGIPDNYYDYLHTTEDDAASIANAIERVLGDPEGATERAGCAQDFIRTNAGPKAQGDRIVAFLLGLPQGRRSFWASRGANRRPE